MMGSIEQDPLPRGNLREPPATNPRPTPRSLVPPCTDPALTPSSYFQMSGALPKVSHGDRTLSLHPGFAPDVWSPQGFPHPQHSCKGDVYEFGALVQVLMGKGKCALQSCLGEK